MTVYIERYDDSYIRVTGDRAFERELSEQFRFKPPGYRFMPAYKFGWTGDIVLYSTKTKLIYAGLFHRIVQWAESAGYSVKFPSEFADLEFSVVEAQNAVNDLNLTKTPRDYQMDGFIKAVRYKRALVLMATASGKSLTMYILARFIGGRTLFIVPDTTLIHQLAGDFVDYGYKENIHKIFALQDKQSDAEITISTWQSIRKLDHDFFNQFDCCIVDEAHNAKATELTKIMTKMTNVPFKYGFTGTTDKTEVNEMVLEGLFGRQLQIIKTHEMISRGFSAIPLIKVIRLVYGNQACADFRKFVESKNKEDKKLTYQREIEWILKSPERNQFIKNLVLSLKGNTLVQFLKREHGELLYKLISEATDRPVYLIHGKVEGEQRNQIRLDVEQQKNAIIIGSVKTTSTGINIVSLKNVILTHPSKARIKTLQTLGRVLRKSDEKQRAYLFDLSDDLTDGKKKKNTTIKHLLERIKFYMQEKLPYKLYNVKLKGQ